MKSYKSNKVHFELLKLIKSSWSPKNKKNSRKHNRNSVFSISILFTWKSNIKLKIKNLF